MVKDAFHVDLYNNCLTSHANTELSVKHSQAHSDVKLSVCRPQLSSQSLCAARLYSGICVFQKQTHQITDISEQTAAIRQEKRHLVRTERLFGLALRRNRLSDK